MRENGRIGKFYIDDEVMQDFGHEAIIKAAQRDVAVTRCEYVFHGGVLECTGFCDEFGEVSLYREPPTYQVIIEMTEDGPVRKAFVPETGERNVKIEKPEKDVDGDDAVSYALAVAMRV